MQKIAIFASGSGTNANNIVNYFSNKTNVQVTCLFCNNSNAGVVSKMENLQIPVHLFHRDDFLENGKVHEKLLELQTDYIILAGFLWLVPKSIVDAFPNRIINIHPSLLPAYGGKGHYGKFVHQAVLENKETESGITIHYVNVEYDKGDIIFQAACPISPNETAKSLAKKIHKLEQRYFPMIIESVFEK